MKRKLKLVAVFLIGIVTFSNGANNNVNTKKGNIMETKKETYVLVHSAWLGAWQWENVASKLRNEGHIVITPDLPGHGNDKTPPATIAMTDYVKAITDILDKQEQPVLLVGHSFNGITVSRVAEIRPNKVKSIVYLTAFLLPKGGSFFSAAQGVEGSVAVDNFYLSEDKTYALVDENEIQNAFAHDIPKEAFDNAKPNIVPEPSAPLMYKLEVTDGNFGRIPKYYIECTEDRAIPVEVQRAMYKGKVKKVFTLHSSHTPNFSQPEHLANILLKIIDEK
ncbi:alpha/beta fold hydrolase [Aquimarina sp. AU58]|uniref:alpha/beta fold hydrolase n=1 Tax=Aquimarina sp. AU58 TaxID=1874112 RepID=UPI00190EEE51|nr:alpha/beta fold hydrolase [Aquimarina sp. AU58]